MPLSTTSVRTIEDSFQRFRCLTSRLASSRSRMPSALNLAPKSMFLIDSCAGSKAPIRSSNSR